jgi:hypothetical protein
MMLPVMISPVSTSTVATTTGVGNIRQADMLRPFGRSQQPPTSSASPSTQLAPGSGANTTPPSRTLPRGSLLDLTV